MSTLNAEAVATLVRQGGLISSSQLRTAGIHKTARRTLVAAGHLTHRYKAVFSVDSSRLTFEQRLIGLSLAHPGSFITGPTAGSYLGLRRMPRYAEINLCVPHGRRLDPLPGVHLRQSTKIRRQDWRALDNGIVIASWPRLVFDLGADLDDLDLSSVIDQVLRAHHCELSDLQLIAAALCHPHRHGSIRFQRVLSARGDRSPVDSHSEIEILDGLRRRGVPAEPQHTELELPDGRRVRIDIAVPSARWAVEIDVHPSHHDLQGATSDKRRDRQLHLIGWQVERVTELDFDDVDRTCDELAALYRVRAAV